MLTVEPETAGARRGERVLDLGCGGGRHAFAFLRAGTEVVALDSSLDEPGAVASMVAAMRAEGEVVPACAALSADALFLPFADASFDLVVASEVLEHLVDDRRAIAELTRVLRLDGRVAVSVPRAGPERLNWALSRRYHEVEGGHVRIYRRRQLLQRLEAAGLRLVTSRHRHALHSPYWWLRCAVGVSRDDQRLVAAYHRFLVWDIERRPALTRALDALLNPLIGKSLVLYLERRR